MASIAGAAHFEHLVCSGSYPGRRSGRHLFCEACHGSPHAIYPSGNDFEANIDNIQPLQYSGTPLPIGSQQSCTVCHLKTPDYALHHPNMKREWRRVELLK